MLNIRLSYLATYSASGFYIFLRIHLQKCVGKRLEFIKYVNLIFWSRYYVHSLCVFMYVNCLISEQSDKDVKWLTYIRKVIASNLEWDKISL